MRYVIRLFWLLILLVVVVFAVTNMEQTVEVNVDPLDTGLPILSPIPVRLALLVIGSLLVGIVVGLFFENGRGRAVRRELRRTRTDLKRLKTESARLQTALKAVDHPESARPALPRPS